MPKNCPLCCDGALRWAKHHVFCVKITFFASKSRFWCQNRVFGFKITLFCLKIMLFASKSHFFILKTSLKRTDTAVCVLIPARSAHCVTDPPSERQKTVSQANPLRHRPPPERQKTVSQGSSTVVVWFGLVSRTRSKSRASRGNYDIQDHTG